MQKGEWQRLVNMVYYHIGARFFPKITWITNRTTWENNEFIPPREKGGLVVVSNHKFLLDPFFVSMAFTGPHVYREIRWVSKIENFTTPIVKSIIFPFGTIPLSPERTLTERTIKEIQYCLKRGHLEFFLLAERLCVSRDAFQSVKTRFPVSCNSRPHSGYDRPPPDQPILQDWAWCHADTHAETHGKLTTHQKQ